MVSSELWFYRLKKLSRKNTNDNSTTLSPMKTIIVNKKEILCDIVINFSAKNPIILDREYMIAHVLKFFSKLSTEQSAITYQFRSPNTSKSEFLS